MKWIIITGNPKDGFAFIGPFFSFEGAMGTAETFEGDWWISQLTDPELATLRDMSQVVEVTDTRD